MMVYTKVGPFVNNNPPAINAAALDQMEYGIESASDGTGLVSSDAPIDPVLHQLWYDETEEILKRWNGDSWEDSGNQNYVGVPVGIVADEVPLFTGTVGGVPVFERFNPFQGSAARTTIVVAAADAPAHVRKAAHYACDGTDDNVEIALAIAEAGPNGRVILIGKMNSGASIVLDQHGLVFQSVSPWMGQNLSGQTPQHGGIWLQPGVNDNIVKVTARKVTIDQLFFDGGKAGQIAGNGISTVEDNSLDLHLSGCYIFRCKEAGMLHRGSASQLKSTYSENNDGPGWHITGNARRNNAVAIIAAQNGGAGFIDDSTRAASDGEGQNCYTACGSHTSQAEGWILRGGSGKQINGGRTSRAVREGILIDGDARGVQLVGHGMFEVGHSADGGFAAIQFAEHGGEWPKGALIAATTIRSGAPNKPSWGIDEGAASEPHTFANNVIEDVRQGKIRKFHPDTITLGTVGVDDGKLTMAEADRRLPALSRAGRWVYTPHAARGTGVVGSNNRALYIPIWLPAGKSYEAIAIEVTAAGASPSAYELVILADAGNWPGDAIVNAGTVDATTTGLKEAAAAFESGEGGLYWLTAVQRGNGATLRRITSPAYSLHTNVPGGTAAVAFQQDAVPDPLVTASPTSELGAAPVIWLREAA